MYYTPGGQAFMTGNAKILYKEYKEQKLKPEINLENGKIFYLNRLHILSIENLTRSFWETDSILTT